MKELLATSRHSKKIRDHRDLRVWRKAIKLAERVGGVIAGFPPEQSRLTVTIQRLSEEIPREIAVGQSRGQYAHYLEHLELSSCAARHLERKLIEAHKRGLIAAETGDPLLAQIAEIVRMLGKLRVSLELAHAQRRASLR